MTLRTGRALVAAAALAGAIALAAGCATWRCGPCGPAPSDCSPGARATGSDDASAIVEDRLEDALRFGRENGQRSVYVLSTGASIAIDAGE